MKEDYKNLGLNNNSDYNEQTETYKEQNKLNQQEDIDNLTKSAEAVAKKINKLEGQKTSLPSNEEITIKEIKKAIEEKINSIEEKNHTDEKIENTPFYKPRNRNLYETDEDYEKFLDNYYKDTFDRKLDEKIQERQVYKPRDRRVDETDQEYEDFLEKYYTNNLTPIPKNALNDNEKHKIISTKQNIRHKLMKKFLIVATWTAIGLSAIFGLKGQKSNPEKANSNKDQNSRIEQNDETTKTNNSIEKEIDRMLNNKKSPKLGDTVKIDKGVSFYYDSQKKKPTGKVGNKYTPIKEKYVITGEAIIDKKTNSIVATNYDKNESLKDTFLKGKDRSKYRRMILISSKESKGKAGTKYDYGWINAKNQGISVENKNSQVTRKGK